MDTCSGEYGADHDEIVYQGKTCPLCDLMIELKEAQVSIEKLEKENTEYDNKAALCQDACSGCPHKLECITEKEVDHAKSGNH